MVNIITFTGAHSTGKTTLRKALVKYLKKKKYTVIDQYRGVNQSVARDAKVFGFEINENTNFTAQYYIAARFIIADIETRLYMVNNNIDYAVLDRNPLDVIPYTRGSPNISTKEAGFISQMLLNHYEMFESKLFYVEPLSDIEEDKTRSPSKNFQNKIVKEFHIMLSLAGQVRPYEIIGNWSVNERLNYVCQKLNL